MTEVVGAIVRRDRPGALDLARSLAEGVARSGRPPLLVEPDVAARLEGAPVAGTPLAEIGRRCGLVVTIGGDGTILLAARLLDGKPAPIWAIHTGGLGFLTETRPEEMVGRLPEILAGRFEIDERMNLHVEVRRGGALRGAHFALNDIVVGGGDGRVTRLSVSVDGAFVSAYEADALILATPTGSTAYSLSAGGPIVHPAADVFVLNPLSPHALTHRPLVLPATKHVEIVLEEGGPDRRYHVSADGVPVVADLAPGDRILCRRGKTPTRLVITRARDIFAVLRERLGWGGRRR